jgi:hypothetical protein
MENIMNAKIMRITSRMLMVSILSLGLPFHAANAAIISTDKVAAAAQIHTERERIRSFLERAEVRQQMQAQGIDANSADARVNALTDQEVQQVVGKLDKLTAGGDVLGIIFTIFIVLLFTDILGVTKVFPFTRSIR